MNASQLINMVLRMVLRPLINRGVNAGINRATRGGAKGATKQPGAGRPAAGDTSKRARQTAKMLRRMGRF